MVAPAARLPRRPRAGADVVAADPAPPTVLSILKRSTTWLESRGIERPRLDVELLMAHALGLKRLDLYLQFERPLVPEELGVLRALVQRRGAGEPVAYLLGSWGFHDLELHVDRRVLVPRPETELLVDRTLECLRGLKGPLVLADVGTGSGCVALALLKALDAARAFAVDLSAEALQVAEANATRLELRDRLELHEGDLLEPLQATGVWGSFDAVVSNPPYVLRGDPSLQPSVAAHEPDLALYVDGDDPLAITRRLAEQAMHALRPGGWLLIELGAGTGPAAPELLEAEGYHSVALAQDLAGIDRVAVGRRPRA